MNDFKENSNINVEMKARIKVNIYKTLLEEEKHKNKRNTTIGLSLFIVGIVSTTALYQIRDESQPQNVKVVQSVAKTSTRRPVPKYLESNLKLDLLNVNVLDSKKVENVKEEDFFVSDFKM